PPAGAPARAATPSIYATSGATSTVPLSGSLVVFTALTEGFVTEGPEETEYWATTQRELVPVVGALGRAIQAIVSQVRNNGAVRDEVALQAKQLAELAGSFPEDSSAGVAVIRRRVQKGLEEARTRLDGIAKTSILGGRATVGVDVVL